MPARLRARAPSAVTVSCTSPWMLRGSAPRWSMRPYCSARASGRAIGAFRRQSGAAARVSLAAAALWIVAILLRRKLPQRWDFAGRVFIQGGVTCVIPYTLIAFGQQSVDSALAAILNSTAPLFVCLICLPRARHEELTVGR